MIISLQSPQNNSVQAIAAAFDSVRKALSRAIARDEATDRILMRSPSGALWSVSVSDTGVLAAEPFVR